jgi:abequosyltransferase
LLLHSKGSETCIEGRELTSTYKLSLCIPTYNRAEFIGKTLDSIASQAGDTVEIIVVDGASSDNTTEVVSGFQARFNSIRYYRENQNSGVDGDLAKAVALAQGEYCWLMSSDDILLDGAIDRVLSEVATDRAAIYLCNIVACTKDLIPVRKLHWLSKDVPDRVFDFSTRDELLGYFAKSISIGALFSYMPSVVVRRADWVAVCGSDEFFGSCYAHVYTLFSIIQKKCRLKYISSPPLLLTRFGNDSASAKGFIKQLMIDFDGYIRLADTFWPKDRQMRNAFLKVMTRMHRWYRILRLRSNSSGDQWRQIQTRLRIIGYSNFIIVICSFLGRFRNTVSLLVHLKRTLRPL